MVEASSVSSSPVSFLMSSSMFLVINSPVYAPVREERTARQVRTWFSLCDDDTASVEDGFQLVEVEIAVGGARSCASGYYGFFDGKLDDEGLRRVRLGRDMQTGTYLCIRKEIIVHEFCCAYFADAGVGIGDAGVGIGDADGLCLCLFAASCRGDFDRDDYGCREDVRVGKQKVLDCL